MGGHVINGHFVLAAALVFRLPRGDKSLRERILIDVVLVVQLGHGEPSRLLLTLLEGQSYRRLRHLLAGHKAILHDATASLDQALRLVGIYALLAD